MLHNLGHRSFGCEKKISLYNIVIRLDCFVGVDLVVKGGWDYIGYIGVASASFRAKHPTPSSAMFLFSSVQNVKTFLSVTFLGLSNRRHCVSHLSCQTSYVASQFVQHPLQCEHKPGHTQGISKSTGHKCIKGESVWRPRWMSVVITGGTILLLSLHRY